ncbi:MAG: hypothetical protein RIB98_08840 [Acidimicrobiales bacterium]
MLGIALYRLRMLMRLLPIASLGPLLGIMAADMAVDIMRGSYGSVIIELAIAPPMAMTVVFTAQRDHAGLSGPLLFILGIVSGFGAMVLLTRGFAIGSGGVVIMGLRHLAVCAYAWAAIATEPAPRNPRPAFAHI